MSFAPLVPTNGMKFGREEILCQSMMVFHFGRPLMLSLFSPTPMPFSVGTCRPKPCASKMSITASDFSVCATAKEVEVYVSFFVIF